MTITLIKSIQEKDFSKAKKEFKGLLSESVGTALEFKKQEIAESVGEHVAEIKEISMKKFLKDTEEGKYEATQDIDSLGKVEVQYPNGKTEWLRVREDVAEEVELSEEEIEEMFNALTEEEKAEIAEAENIPLEELSKKTLSNYVKKANRDYGDERFTRGLTHQDMSKKDKKDSYRRGNNRIKGIEMAVDRLAK